MPLSVAGLQGVAIATLLVEGVIGAVVPFLFTARFMRHLKMPISILTALSGGVFLAATFAHMFPHLSEVPEALGLDEHFPLGFIIAATIYCILLLVEEVTLSRAARLKLNLGHSCGHIHGAEEHVHDSNCPSEPGPQPHDEHGCCGHDPEHSSCSQHDAEDVTPVVVFQEPQPVTKPAATQPNVMGSAVLALALAIHSILAGLALGAATDMHTAEALFIALGAHKWSDTLVGSVSFINSSLSWRMAVLMQVILCTSTPIGVGIGMAVQAGISDKASAIVEAVANSVTTGSFLFVALNEIVIPTLQVNRHKGSPLWLRALILALSFAGMSAVFVLTDSHGHEHSE